MALQTCFFRTALLGSRHQYMLDSAFFSGPQIAPLASHGDLNKMAMNIKKLFATPESRSSLMLIGGILSLLGSLVVATFVWRRWGELGVIIGSRGWIGVAIISIATIVLAVATGIWALHQINSLTGPRSIKCTIASLLNALALAILMAFLMVAYFLRFAA